MCHFFSLLFLKESRYKTVSTQKGQPYRFITSNEQFMIINWTKHVVISNSGELSTEMALPFDEFKFVSGHIVQVRKKNKSHVMFF